MSKKEEEMNAANNDFDIGFWRDLWQQARLAWRLLRDPAVPFYLKLLPLAAAVYLVIPFDFVPDLLPVIGQLDDITAVLVGLKVFIEMAPPEVVARHLDDIHGEDGLYPHPNDEKVIILDPDELK